MQNEQALNKSEKDARYEALYAIGCLCCRINIATKLFKATGLRCEIHHLNQDGKHGNKRRGDEFTIPLCTWHHRGKGVPPNEPNKQITVEEMAAKYGPSWVQSGNRFHEEYPTDDELLEFVNGLIATGNVQYIT